MGQGAAKACARGNGLLCRRSCETKVAAAEVEGQGRGCCGRLGMGRGECEIAGIECTHQEKPSLDIYNDVKQRA